MRALFGIVSLLLVLALVGWLVAKQMKASERGLLPSLGSGASTPVGRSMNSGNSGSALQQSRQVQQRIKDEVARALAQGAASRAEAADQ